ncbi:hypothetical protein M408DRAFT_331991 [Serendipita vermifera MAFF 305830]|uniref:HMG box domain-containing protein n=1 Tax=Serendipita vermifera MAFF 305830 TaxID=933852 RepID=A0A0C3AVT3_SERVB|nr:hypothetical protein M408DRAFT_331991 [Serendipita vermifera MAFF 305830]
MPKSSTKSASAASSSSPAADTKGKREKSAYQIWCSENRERVKAEFPDLKGKDILVKLNDQWWDAEENPKRGQRPEKKPKKAKATDGSEKENKTKGKGKKAKRETEASSEP